MILSDTDLHSAQQRHKILDPFIPENVQPASIDLILGEHYIRREQRCELCEKGYTHENYTYSGDLKHNVDWMSITYTWDERPYLEPDDFVLATTKEWVSVPPHLAAQISGKSSWMRRGLQICNDAGWCDPAFNGNVTLELKNLSHEPVELSAGVLICQIVFMQMSSIPAHLYGSAKAGSHYQNQVSVKESVL